MALATYLTAHKDNWRWIDTVEDATLTVRDAGGQAVGDPHDCKARMSGVVEPDYTGAGQFQTVSEDTTCDFWKAESGAPTPNVNDKLTIDSVNWIIIGVDDSRLGDWSLKLRKAKG